MRLMQWMYKNKITPQKLAKDLNYQDSYIRKIMRGMVKPGPKFSSLLLKHTKGEVDFTSPDYDNLPADICDCCKRPL